MALIHFMEMLIGIYLPSNLSYLQMPQRWNIYIYIYIFYILLLDEGGIHVMYRQLNFLGIPLRMTLH